MAKYLKIIALAAALLFFACDDGDSKPDEDLMGAEDTPNDEAQEISGEDTHEPDLQDSSEDVDDLSEDQPEGEDLSEDQEELPPDLLELPEDLQLDEEDQPEPPVYEEHNESEPNDGATLEDFNPVSDGWRMLGQIEGPGDIDIFKLEIPPGQIVSLRLAPRDEGPFQGHLTVFDAGRGTKPPADDYIKIIRPEPNGEVLMELLSLGEGGYYIGVQELTNVDGGQSGGDDFNYFLEIDSTPIQKDTLRTLSIPESFNDTLRHRGAIQLYHFEATEGMNLIADLNASSSAPPFGMDARLVVVSSEGDWVARNDNRALDDPDPLLDAPIYTSGDAYLMVDNISEIGESMDYHLSLSQ